ncbi:MAG: TetR/AcrR family transcriptional regulator [Chthoniobacter sp.]|uniref:TetR/AcrR family transcriptional regulator n=1 Tax=Chthoniobacter sp. TaxID=2510640 RepID=UPI0032A9F5D7
MTPLLDSRKDSKRALILGAARRRFGRFGIRATTMQEIARDTDIAVGTIYQFFPDKDALIRAWVTEHCQQMHDELVNVLRQPVHAEDKLRQFLTLRFRAERAMREEAPMHEVAKAVRRLMPEMVQETVAAVFGYLRTILEEGRETGSLPSVEPDADSEILFHSLRGFFPTVDDPILGPPEEKTMLRVIDWFVAKWKLPRPKSQP